MDTSADTSDTVEPPPRAEAVRLARSFDAQRILAELTGISDHPWEKQRDYDPRAGLGTANPLDWRVLPLRSPGGDLGRTDPGGPGDDFRDTDWLGQLPYLRTIVDGIAAPLQAVRVMSFGPGAASTVHSDRKYSLRLGFVRLHIPVVTNPDAVLTLDGVAHRWQPGEFWYGDFSKVHQARNDGTQARIHVVLDALLTRELTDLFPAHWQPALMADDVLLNRPSSPVAPGAGARLGRAFELPRSFVAFDRDGEAAGGPSVPVRITAADGRMQLTTADGEVLNLVHVGDDEFRFAGWSEQRTLQLRAGTAVLRTRDSGTVRTTTVPTEDVAPH